MTDIRSEIRQTHQQYRQSLTPEQRETFASQLAKNISSHDLFLSHQHIAFYMANDGEMDPYLLIETAWKQNKNVYLPVLKSGEFPHLYFAKYNKNEELKKNKYSIPEPKHDPDQLIPSENIDVVFMPLVAVDSNGNRIGMGAGYYDRTFAFKKDASPSAKPLLIGLAYEEQIVECIRPEPWDIPLDGFFTEQGYYT